MGERSREPTQRLGGGKEGGEDKGRGQGKEREGGLALRQESFRESSSKWET